MRQRLQKIISSAGLASRRAAEELIKAGRVTVNGRKASLGDSADMDLDVVCLDGRALRPLREHTYIMLNKPRGYVTTMSDELDRRCVTELLKDFPARVYPVGRLDRNSEGLLLFTNDGNFSNDIMHPSRHVSKTYRVTVRPPVSEEQLARLSAGVEIDGRKTLPASVDVLVQEQGRVVLQIVIREGRNRQIRKMCESVNLEVARLKRTAIGPLRLGMLKPGAYRELTSEELRAIRSAVGEK